MQHLQPRRELYWECIAPVPLAENDACTEFGG